ncbi:agglutinin-2 [Quercus suber]|uniref:Agglutinin-2 n=1 Tax=Quercus suber TaxID=58331 RepID=A0AAW0LT50_QUESU
MIIFFLLSLPHANSVYFNLSSFQPSDSSITFQGDAYVDSQGLQLTKNTQTALLSYSVGRALYSEQVRLWDNNTGWLADFTTHFSFIIKAVTAVPADGLTFFIAPFGSKMPNNSTGRAFGLLSSDDALNGTHNQIVAVEFDTFKNQFDPSSDHVGIDVNSIVSKANVTWNSSISNGSTANTWISYNSTTKILSVFLTYADNPVFSGNSSLSYSVDLRTVLPEWISVGLSAATGANTETNTVLSWSFNSTSELVDGVSQTNNTGTRANVNTKNWNMKNKLALIIGLAVSFGGVSCALGDFGLARLVDHELGSQTTVLAGTMGYLAPECAITGKASKESDVYSFGVVSLEITCGRKPIQLQAEPSKVSLVEWVWDLYGKHQLLEAVDKRLSMEFDEKQMECLMVVGLWCCHPDPTIRPSIRQVINVLNFEAPFPVLSSKLPVPMYDEPSMHMCRLSYTPTSHLGSIKGQPLCSCSSCSTNSSTSVGLSKPLLNSGKADVELTSVSY